MRDADECQRRAAEADEAGARTHDLDLKRQWGQIADQWRRLARQREQLSVGGKDGQSSDD
jgi:hypothetical protein